MGSSPNQEHSLDWLVEVPHAEDDRSWDEFIARIGPMVMGASTYQWMLEHEQLLTHPKRWEVYYADRPCWVFTHRDLPGIPGVDVRFVQGDVRAAYDDMVTARPGQDVWLVGGRPGRTVRGRASPRPDQPLAWRR
jgi:dihydrofolate reductase